MEEGAAISTVVIEIIPREEEKEYFKLHLVSDGLCKSYNRQDYYVFGIGCDIKDNFSLMKRIGSFGLSVSELSVLPFEDVVYGFVKKTYNMTKGVSSLIGLELPELPALRKLEGEHKSFNLNKIYKIDDIGLVFGNKQKIKNFSGIISKNCELISVERFTPEDIAEFKRQEAKRKKLEAEKEGERKRLEGEIEQMRLKLETI